MKIRKPFQSLIITMVLMVAATTRAQTETETLIETVVAGCKPSQFVVGTEENVIAALASAYSPKCLKIKRGANVTIQASSRHPLSGMADVNGARNPIALMAKYTTAQTWSFAETGVFGYYCNNHGDAEGDGMAGVIVVE